MATLNVFATSMRNMANAVPHRIAALQREVALNVVEHVANTTPIDTGQASGNWKTAIGAPDLSWTPGPSAPLQSYSEAQRVLRGLSHGQDVYITNNVPYIALLNAGYSLQAPSLFVETAIVSAIAQMGQFNIVVR